MSTGTLLASQAAPRPTGPTEALDLRVALEDPATGQAEKVANAFRPPIGGRPGASDPLATAGGIGEVHETPRVRAEMAPGGATSS